MSKGRLGGVKRQARESKKTQERGSKQTGKGSKDRHREVKRHARWWKNKHRARDKKIMVGVKKKG